MSKHKRPTSQFQLFPLCVCELELYHYCKHYRVSQGMVYEYLIRSSSRSLPRKLSVDLRLRSVSDLISILDTCNACKQKQIINFCQNDPSSSTVEVHIHRFIPRLELANQYKIRPHSRAMIFFNPPLPSHTINPMSFQLSDIQSSFLLGFSVILTNRYMFLHSNPSNRLVRFNESVRTAAGSLQMRMSVLLPKLQRTLGSLFIATW